MRRRIALSLALVIFTAAASGPAAGEKNDVVLTVGKTTLTAAEVERRIRSIPSFQLATLGKTPQEIRKNFIEKVLVPELLHFEEASRREVEKTPVVRDRVRDALRQALENKIREDSTKVTPEEIASYYEANRHRFITPRRIKIWRILVKDEATAKKIIEDVRGNDIKATPSWNKYAREVSTDKATNMRDGDLGFVTPEGQTEMPQVRVDPALFNAADKVKDGEVVTEPVKEGESFAVVWRRGSLEAVTRSLAQEAPAITQIVGRQKVAETLNELAGKLQQEQVKNVNYELLNYVQVDSSGDVGTRQKPGVLPRHRPRGPAAPQKDERGLR